MKVKIVNKSAFDLPQYATSQSAGLDLRANISEAVIMKPLERKLIFNGTNFELVESHWKIIDNKLTE
jgi:dUTP pyrophosphatase